jgi:hypothetical protein
VTWVGGGVDTNWSTAANWSTNSVPTTTDIVVFDGTTTTNAIIDAGFGGTVAGVQINSGYTGSITPNRSLTVNGDFVMATGTGGTFLGSANVIDINGNFTMSNGTFWASSATTSISGSFRPMGGTFIPNNGTVVIDGTGTSYINLGSGGLSLANLTFNKTLSSDYISYEESDPNLIVTSTLTLMSGNLLRFSSSTNFTTNIEAAGPVVWTSSTFEGGNGGNLYFTGTGQTITVPSGAVTPGLNLNATSSILNFSGAGVTTTPFSLNVYHGTANANSANMNFSTSLVVDGPNAIYNGGSGNTYIDSTLHCFDGSTTNFGTGSVQIGVILRVHTSSVLNMSTASAVTFAPVLAGERLALAGKLG